MPIDEGIRAEMTHIVMREKELKKEREQIEKDLPIWDKRVGLARQKGRPELAVQAEEKAEELRTRRREISTQLDILDQEKSVLRYESRRPSGIEVARAEHMVEQVRLGGLIDPDKAKVERELRDLVEFDFDDDKED